MSLTALTHLCLSFCLCVDAWQVFSHDKGSSNYIHSIEQPREQIKALTETQKLSWSECHEGLSGIKGGYTGHE